MIHLKTTRGKINFPKGGGEFEGAREGVRKVLPKVCFWAKNWQE
jgi:hypothetical protein